MRFKVKYRRFLARYLSKPISLTYRIKFKYIQFKKPPVIILTPGKVGSSTVYNTLNRQTDFPVFHIHRLTQQGIEKAKRVNLNSDRKSLPLHLIVSELLREKLEKYNGEIKIITVVREPIAREISSFFQNSEMYKKTLELKNLEIDKNQANQILKAIFRSKICLHLKDWFHEEIKEGAGIDVFSENFDIDKKFMILKNDKISILLLRMEDMNLIFSKAIKEFLNLKNVINLENSNISEEKFYALDYQNIKEKTKLSPNTINEIINSNYFKQFYIDYQEKVIEKWQRKTF